MKTTGYELPASSPAATALAPGPASNAGTESESSLKPASRDGGSRAKKSPVYSAPALEKGFDILELLADQRKPMSLAQIASALDRSKSELYRMLAVLEARRYLRREEGSDEFHITNKLFDLGMSVPPVGTLTELAYPLLHKLAAETDQSCHLSVNSGNRVVVVARAESPFNVGVSVRVGHHVELCESGCGLVMMAWMNSFKRERLFTRFSEERSDFDDEQMRKELERIRAQGLEIKPSSTIQGVTDLSCPIVVQERGEAIGTMTIPFAKLSDSGINQDEAVERLRDTARQLSEMSLSYSSF